LEAIVKPRESFEGGSVLAVRDFRIYLGATFLASLAVQAQSVAVRWQVYKITASPLSLGYVGLVQFLPTLALTLHAGAAADRHDRRLIMSASALTRAITASAFVALSIANVSKDYCRAVPASWRPAETSFEAPGTRSAAIRWVTFGTPFL
jgi:MFS family permease